MAKRTPKKAGKPLRQKLGAQHSNKLAKAVSDNVKKNASKPPAEIARLASQALEVAMDDLVCIYNPQTGELQWYDTTTKRWGGLC